MAYKVCKFGGSSLAEFDQVRKVLDIVTSDPSRRIVVVSAPGDRLSVKESGGKDIKVTELLIKAVEAHSISTDYTHYLDETVFRYDEIRAGFGLPDELTEEIRAGLQARLDEPGLDAERFRDLVIAGGEDNMARLFAAILNKLGHPAQYVDPCEAGMLLDDKRCVLPKSYDLLASLRDLEGIVVFPGFFGYTEPDEDCRQYLVTFPRGGSDITGAIVAAAVRADIYENFTDKDAVCAANPNIVPNAKPVAHLTYREMRELSYSGFNIFQEEAPLPAMHRDIPINIRNTNAPDAPGTMVTRSRESEPGQVMGIASKDGFCTLLVSKFLMNREVGYVRKLMHIIEQEEVPVEHMPSGIDDVSVILRKSDLKGGKAGIILDRIRAELEPDEARIIPAVDDDGKSAEPGLALIMVVGEGMKDTPGITCRVATALAERKINIEVLNQGASEISLMVGISESDLDGAVEALHAEFFE